MEKLQNKKDYCVVQLCRYTEIKMKQISNHLLMIEPVSFSKNAQTAVNNYYQKDSVLSPLETQKQALAEFKNFAALLQSKGIEVTVVKDTVDPETPDSIFPNNWISFHEDSRIGIYPMFAENRRNEVRLEILDQIGTKGYKIGEIVDLRKDNLETFLEGTGSIVLDRINRIAYCALSPRADRNLFLKFCSEFSFKPHVFHAYQNVGTSRELIYHTNVMMCVGDSFVVICLDCVDDVVEKNSLIEQFKKDGKEIITVSEEQVNSFAGNMLQVQNNSGDKFLIMSKAAHGSLSKEQVDRIERFNPILSSDLSTIETCGGGSARCMMAEVFLPKLN
jgi:hypothetical protein